MRAVTIAAPGGPEKLVPTTLPDPRPGPGQVLIAVTAAGVNRADLLQRAGHYPPPPGAPDWPGMEISGEIAAVGAGVTWRTGDHVVALLDGGGYADRACVPAAQVLPAPSGISLVDAAALPEAICTAWSNLVDTGRLRRGEWVLIHGGSGGVGVIAIQLAKALGAHVITTAGGPERGARCLALGADVAVDHRAEDFVEAVRAATDGRGVDVVLDIVGAAYLERNLAALAPDGRLVVIGMQKGRRAELDLGMLLTRRVSVIGTTLRARPPHQKAQIITDVLTGAWPLIESGRIHPVVHAVLPLDHAGDAHRMLESGAVFGKILLAP